MIANPTIPSAKDIDATAVLTETLAACSTEGLKQLRQAFWLGRVIRSRYVQANGDGCLLYWLTGVQSREELIAYCYFTDRQVWAARCVIKVWDDQRLPAEMVVQALNAELLLRQMVECEDGVLSADASRVEVAPETGAATPRSYLRELPLKPAVV